MIVGQPGAGKSTLARALGVATGLPVVHMDMIHWQPGIGAIFAAPPAHLRAYRLRTPVETRACIAALEDQRVGTGFSPR
jgi:dephospho-CoA kinase